jgi:hypothetical protein
MIIFMFILLDWLVSCASNAWIYFKESCMLIKLHFSFRIDETRTKKTGPLCQNAVHISAFKSHEVKFERVCIKNINRIPNRYH